MKNGFLWRCVILILAVVSITYFRVSTMYSKVYKIGWNEDQLGKKITGFSVTCDDKELGIFDSKFEVNVSIKGTTFDADEYVGYIKATEYLEIIDNKTVAVVEFDPMLESSVILPHNNNNAFETEFKHTLYPYEYGNLIYILRCGDFEKRIYIKCDK